MLLKTSWQEIPPGESIQSSRNNQNLLIQIHQDWLMLLKPPEYIEYPPSRLAEKDSGA